MYIRSKITSWIGLAFLMIAVAACGGDADLASDQTTPADTVATGDTADLAAERPKLNLNTATEEEFGAIPGVGDHMVAEFFEYRPYVSIRQFRREIGKYVDEEQVAAYEQYVFVPVEPNESDAETLQQLPGIDASAAEELIAGRPYESTTAFLDALSAHVSGEEQAAAETYLAAS